MTAPEPSRDPKAPARIIPVSKPLVAQSQLETAILLWFHYGDPVSIQALAHSANDCYHAIGKMTGLPTSIQIWLKSLSRTNYDRVIYSIQFCKHGPKGLKRQIYIFTEFAELLMLDSVICHNKLFQSRTPLMHCFFARLTWENSRLRAHVNAGRRKEGRQEIVSDDLVERDREKFLAKELPLIAAGLRG